MSSVSNQPFEEIELRSWRQVSQVAGKEMLRVSQVASKRLDLQQYSNYSYTEEDVRRKVQEEQKQHAVQGGALTTRQKMMASRAGAGGPEVAPPMKMQRNVLGQAIIAERDG